MKKAALIAVSIITVMLLAACGKAESTVPAANAGNYRQVLRWRYLGKRNLHYLPAGESR